MNAKQIIEMKAQIREMQSIVNEVSNTAAGEMLSKMNETREAYTATDLSNMTEGILTPSQATAVVRAIDRIKNPRNRSGRPSATKYQSVRNFTHLNVQYDVISVPTYSIACDASGQPLKDAVIRRRDTEKTTYRLTENGNNDIVEPRW